MKNDAKLYMTGRGTDAAVISRFEVIDYVRSLVTAPDGSRITSTEKNVLMILAQSFNPALGVAWPSIRKIAEQACISERHCQRMIVRLVRKKVIQRVPMRRADLGGQTSNEYFFPALGRRPQTVLVQRLRLEIQKIRRTPMTDGGGPKRQRQSDNSAACCQTHVSGAPGHQRPPIESLKGNMIDSSRERAGRSPRALATSQETLDNRNYHETISNNAKSALTDSGLARSAWESALQEVRITNGAKEFRSLRFHDVRVSSVRVNSSGGVIVELRSPDAEKTTLGIQKFEVNIARALRRFYGCDVKLQCLGEDANNSEDAASNALNTGLDKQPKGAAGKEGGRGSKSL